MGGERRRTSAPGKSTSYRGGASKTAAPSPGRMAAGAGPLIAADLDEVAQLLTSADVLDLQRTAGNRAVSTVMQRAAGPLDDTVPGVAVADTLPEVPAPGAAQTPATAPAQSSAVQAPAVAQPGGPEAVVPTGASTAAGSLPPVPARPAGTGAVSEPVGPGGVVPVGGGGPVAMGGQVEAGFAGAVDQTAKRQLTAKAAEVPDFAVEATYAASPSKVFRSPSDEWHYQLWNFQKGPGQGDEPPTAFRAGGIIAVAPDYQGQATSLPSYSGDDRTGLGTGAPATSAATATPAVAGSPGVTPAPPSGERPMIRAIAPGFAPGPEPPGRQTARVASHDEVVAALAADPRSVIRSPNDTWHAQGYELDLGQGSAPTAYKVGGVIILAPGYPSEGLPATPAGPTSGSPAGAAAVTAGPGAGTTAPATATAPAPTAPLTAAATTPAATTPGAVPEAERRTRTDLSATQGAPGVAGEVMVEDVTTAAGMTTRNARGGTASVGGDDVIQVGGQQVTTTTTGDTSQASKIAGNVALKPDGSLAVTGERTRETFAGTDPAGDPIKTGATSTFGGVDVSEKGFGATGGASQTTAAGDKHTASASVKIDPSGNVSGTLAYQYQTKGGTSLTPSVSGGVEVQASDPIPAAGGGFDVTFTLSDSKGASIAAGKQVGGGPSVGLQAGTTDASLETGTMHFADVAQAKAFRDNAAAVIVRERYLHQPPTTIAGALEIPIGEERGQGNVSGSSIGGSVSMEGATVGYGRSSSTTHRFSVKRVSETMIQVTGLVSGTKGSDWSISGGLSNTKGSSATKGFEATWEFDLKSDVGRAAFERYAQTGLPPMGGARLLSMTSSGSEEDHDNVSIPLMGTARWTGTTWEVVKTDAKGSHEQFGGQQAHDQDPSWFGRHVLDEDELHSSAQIVSSVEGDTTGKQKEGYQAQIKVSGESGDYNREQLGKMFMGAAHQGDAKASGEWTLSAEVSPAVVRELERNNKEMREAKTREDKMRVYSKLVKERGAAMVGAQVGLGGDATAWNVELKGDKNFPGEAGRAALDGKRAELKAKLHGDPANARAVVGEVQRTLDELQARRTAVADHTRYTDLPDGLRDEQLKLIDKHISDFEFIRHAASQEAIKGAPGETIETVRGRMADQHGYKDAEHSAEGAEMARLRDRIADKEAAIKELDPTILEAINAVMQAESHMLNMPPGFAGFAREHRASYNEHWGRGVDINDRQMAMAPKADALRTKLLEYLSPAERKATAEALLAQLNDRLTLLQVLHGEVVAAAEALKPITTARGFARHEGFWAGITGDDPPSSDWGSD